jgi:hypothetical protein
VALSDPEVLEDLFTAAGFVDVRTEIADYPIVGAAGAEEYWDVCERSAGPFILLLASVGEEQRRAMREDAIAEMRAMFPGGRVTMIAETLITRGVKKG